MQTLEKLFLSLVLAVSLAVGALLVAAVPDFRDRDVRRGNADFEEISLNNVEADIGQSELMNIISRLKMVPSVKRRRPIAAVVVENHVDARPHQIGLKDALMIQEHMVEGLISRFIALYDARELPDIVGPVRSLRPYFIDSILPLSRAVIYAGGSPDALERAEHDPNLFAVNGLYLDDGAKDGAEFFRMPGIPAPHDLFTGRKSMSNLLPKDIGLVSWPPYETGGAPDGTGATFIKINFFNRDYNVEFGFKRVSGKYVRTNGGVLSEAEPKNVVILEMPINGEGEYGRLDIDAFVGGEAILFRSGRVYPGRWSRAADGNWFAFKDLSGEPMLFAQGQTWMMVIPGMERVAWE